MLNPVELDVISTPVAGAGLECLLSGASASTRAHLMQIARITSFRARDIVVRQGDELALTILLEGWVAVRRTSPDGRVFTLILMRAGHVLGIRSVWRRVPSDFELVALTPGQMATLPGAAVRQAAERDGALAVRLFDLAVGTSVLIARRLDEATFDDARKRLATVLLAYENLVSAVSPIVSRADVASLIGTSREMLGRAIRALENEGAIRRDGRRILITDRAILQLEADWANAGRDHAHWLRVLADWPRPPHG
jgi:CRP/FNR family transcriptional regulator